jgi:DNA-binding transcriptional LysR family regulator
MRIRELEAFRAILETGTVSQAARSLGVSQPAVSRMLSRLEKDIGFELFHRISGRLVATRPALALSRDVLATLENVENLGKSPARCNRAGSAR